MLIALWNCLENIGEKPSANAIIGLARRQGHAFRDGDAKAVFRELSARPGTAASVPAPQNTHGGTGGAVPGTNGPRLRAGASADLKGLSLIRDTASETSSEADPPIISADQPKPKRTPMVRPPAPVATQFTLAERDVANLIAACAAQNATGMISANRIAAIRAELAARCDGDEPALQEAIRTTLARDVTGAIERYCYAVLGRIVKDRSAPLSLLGGRDRDIEPLDDDDEFPNYFGATKA